MEPAAAMLTFYTVKFRAEKHKGITDCPAGSERLTQFQDGDEQ